MPVIKQMKNEKNKKEKKEEEEEKKKISNVVTDYVWPLQPK